MSIHSFPRCSAYLKGMRIKTNDPEMTDYWFAVLLADKFSDSELIRDGRVNFETMDGADLLNEFERLLGSRNRPVRELSYADMESLKALLGARGVKVSRLNGPDDYWQAAMLLWPTVITRADNDTLLSLLGKIKAMPKKQRQIACNRNAIPNEWRGAA